MVKLVVLKKFSNNYFRLNFILMKKTKQQLSVKPDSLFEVKDNTTLMVFLIENMSNKSRQNIKSLLSNKQVLVNGMVESQFNLPLKSNDKVTVKWTRLLDDKSFKSFRGFSIMFEDEHMIVIDKHAGILSIATKGEKEITAYNFLSKHVKFEDPTNKIFIVHRLDRETSGLMIFAKSEKVQHLFQDNWKDMVLERIYVAIVEGTFEEDEGEISSYLHENKSFVVYSDQNPINGKKAVTHFKVMKSNQNLTMLEVKLDTGRKNQIRVHMQDIGHPIINDKKYGSKLNPISRLGLHSRTLDFIHPITQEHFRFTTPLPRKFSRLF